MRRKFLEFLVALAASAALPAGAAPKTEPKAESKGTLPLGAAVNKAGRQRMLSQRMAKAYLMLALGVLPERARPILDESIARFESQLVELKSLLPNDEARAAHAALEHAWTTYSAVLTTTPSTEGAAKIWDVSEVTLASAHRLTMAYEKASGTAASHLVNISGRQRMLSQRVAKFALFRLLAVKTPQALEEIDKARREFVAAQAELNRASLNTADIKVELQLADVQWILFDHALSLSDSEKGRAARDVATTSERILEVMESVVSRYEKFAT